MRRGQSCVPSGCDPAFEVRLHSYNDIISNHLQGGRGKGSAYTWLHLLCIYGCTICPVWVYLYEDSCFTELSRAYLHASHSELPFSFKYVLLCQWWFAHQHPGFKSMCMVFTTDQSSWPQSWLLYIHVHLIANVVQVAHCVRRVT